MTIIVNGEKREISNSILLGELLKELEINPDKVVVELNRDIVEKEKFDSVILKEKDKLEIVQFVGGG